MEKNALGNTKGFQCFFKDLVAILQKEFDTASIDYISNDGGIINVSSRFSQGGIPGYSVYASMKRAIETLTRYQAEELETRGIRINSVALVRSMGYVQITYQFGLGN